MTSYDTLAHMADILHLPLPPGKSYDQKAAGEVVLTTIGIARTELDNAAFDRLLQSIFMKVIRHCVPLAISYVQAPQIVSTIHLTLLPVCASTGQKPGSATWLRVKKEEQCVNPMPTSFCEGLIFR